MLKKLGITFLGLSLLTVGVGASGLTPNEAQGMSYNGFAKTGTVEVKAEVWFTPSWKVANGAGYKLKPGKYVQRAYVRIQEGDYDSGRQKTKRASSKKDKNQYFKSTSKWNNPAKTMKVNYGWEYFK
ncbi:hypothetical protein [Marininema halotolerans]|uniref:Uncharacterized protein n=1 Tax=Marininema halotolerans TaxID=1155944 RepID=A0A1I6NUY9_9BACL|nr:hypothetical protein [Marininema halotolerans]SFS31679.1 hypothetical protein SAMN05444972_101152 [Marininema halotolerans]